MNDKYLVETKVVWIGDDKLQHYSFKSYKQGKDIHFYKQKFAAGEETKARLTPLTEMEEISFEEYRKYKNGETI